MIRRGAAGSLATEVVDDLTARGYLDDAAFARHWAETRAARGVGPIRLRAELAARGVAPALIDAALAGVASDATLEGARAAARRRLPVVQRARSDRSAARLRDHLLRRGYPASVVDRVVRELLGTR